IILILISLSWADRYSYSHDFSTDPGWITNDPSWFYWNSALETYHLTTISNGSAKYTYTNIDWSDQTFAFKYDIKITQDGYGSGIWFGVYSTGMRNYHDNHIVAHLGRHDAGHNIFLFTCANNIPDQSTYVDYPWPMNTWFRVEVYYDAPTNSAQMIVMTKATGDTLAVLSHTLPDTLTSLVKFGASSRDISVYYGTFQAEIDNVEFAWATYTIEATIDITPNVLNLKSHGRWVTCHIELPEGYSVEDIDLNTVALTAIDGTPIDSLYREGPTNIGDHNNNGIPDLMVKFNRGDLIDVLETMVEPPVYVELTVTGELTDGPLFEGSDVVRVICPGSGPLTTDREYSPGFAFRVNCLNVVSDEIRFSVGQSAQCIELMIYDITGRLVKNYSVSSLYSLVPSVITWDGRDNSGKSVPNGVYFIKFKAGDYTEIRKLLLLR
ncbi:MAG: hypothetical protein JSV97_10785, partial [candidate division WOR-3 bacterium]